jgi:hypothetical protein
MASEIIPSSEELIHETTITVSRDRVSGANQFGRPIAETLDSQTFQDLKGALIWTAESPEYSHYFSIPLTGVQMSGELYGPSYRGREMLAIRYNGKVGESMRDVERHHAVSTDYTEDFFDLIVYLEPNQGPLFDRGVVWVDIASKNPSPKLKFNINAGIHTPEEIETGIIQMASRVNQVLDDLVQGMGIGTE